MYYTIIHLACSNAGATGPAMAFNNTWSLFSGPANVKNAYGDSLYYYQSGISWANQCNTIDCLLESKNGQCQSWVELLQYAGIINGNQFLIVFAKPSIVGDSLFIKNWSTTGFTYGVPPYIYRMYTGNFSPNPPVGFDLVNGSMGDLSNGSGLAGQNTTTPAEKVFGTHVLFRPAWSFFYYDPSYGLSYTGSSHFKSAAVFGFCNSIITQGSPPGPYRNRTDVAPSSNENVNFTEF